MERPQSTAKMVVKVENEGKEEGKNRGEDSTSRRRKNNELSSLQANIYQKDERVLKKKNGLMEGRLKGNEEESGQN